MFVPLARHLVARAPQRVSAVLPRRLQSSTVTAPGQPQPSASSSRTPFAVSLPDPEPDEPEPAIAIPSILPPEERTDDAIQAFVLHNRSIHVVSPGSGREDEADPARITHLPSEMAPAEQALEEELDRGPGNPRTVEEIAALAEQAGESASGLVDRASSAISSLLPSDRKEIPFQPIERPLNQEERSGLLALAAILVGGLLIGEIGAPRDRRRRNSREQARAK